MKRFLSGIIVFCMLLSAVTVFADSTSSKAMEEVLLSVKERVDIPAELTEFTPRTFEAVDRGLVGYTFMWSDKKGNAHIEVSCDEKGRINRYYFYDNALKSEKKLTSLSKEEITGFAEEFLKKTVPEAFVSESDTLVFDSDSWNVNNLNYSIGFHRMKNGVAVKDNGASLRVIVCDDVPYVRNMDVYMKYEASFDEVPTELAEYTQKYMAAFPIELVYKDKSISLFHENGDEEKNKTVLVYRYKDNESGYILASSGEVAKEDDLNDLAGGGSGGENFKAEASMQDSVSRNEMFTEQELAELDKIKELIPKEKVRAILEKFPYIGFEKNMEMSEYEIYGRDEKYSLVAGFSDKEKERYISAAFDGVSGELLNLFNRVPYKGIENEKELTEEQKKGAEEKLDTFLKAVAGEKLSEFELHKSDVYGKRLSRNFDRIVNGVRYINDGVYAEFDADSGFVTSYRMDFDEKKEFDGINAVIGKEKAYNSILSVAPLKKLYVHTGGNYKVCYTVSKYGTEIDAFTGEEYNPYYGTENDGIYEYSDLEGHWAKEKICKLAEAQIGFKGEKFRPDDAITQLDLLKLFAAGVRYKYYLNYSEEDIYSEFIEEKILAEDEKNPSGQVKREDAFVYMVRLDGLERVAKLHNIFRVEYEDGHLLTEGKIGYPAILTGMNIICGDGGLLRPVDSITRAEAAVMVYNYMMK